MSLCVKHFGEEFRERYEERLNDIVGCIGVLEELVMENIKKKKKGEKLEEGEYVFNNNNFNLIYEAVLDMVSGEECQEGFSQYRVMLDRVDKKLDKLTADDRKDIRRMEEGVARGSVGPHNINKDYAKPVFHISAYSIDLMGVA